jgi:nicotinate phosphoribosyltransferase
MNPGSPFSLALLTDLYELTMMQGYHQTHSTQHAVFEMFFRRQPFDGGFSIFTGLEPLIDILLNLKFRDTDISYLRSLKIFSESFLEYLSKFQFSGDLWAMPEGSVVFPNEPLLRVSGTILEGQLIESMILNTINFQTLIATKTARVVHAANGGTVIEFGLRRAQGVDGAISATRAAYIGGASATSNVLGGAMYGIPVRGTMAHSWIMSFKSEYEAFERYSELFPNNCVFLVDTYDTLKSGIPNAIRVLSGLKNKGYTNFGIRLDSGDLEYLSRRARELLDAAGLSEAKIIASNELDEWIINQIVKNNSPIDGWGVGSKIVTADRDPFLTGVYKLVAKGDSDNMQPVMKISNDLEKITTPGVKNVLRFYDSLGTMLADLIYIESEEGALMEKVNLNIPIVFQNPSLETDSFALSAYSKTRKLLMPVIQKGSRCAEPSTIQEAQSNARYDLGSLDEIYKWLIDPHQYKVCISKNLNALKTRLIAGHKTEAVLSLK